MGAGNGVEWYLYGTRSAGARPWLAGKEDRSKVFRP